MIKRPNYKNVGRYKDTKLDTPAMTTSLGGGGGLCVLGDGVEHTHTQNYKKCWKVQMLKKLK